MADIKELNQQHGIPGQIEFSEGKGGLPVVLITNKYAAATVSLYGAHVLSYHPKGEKELLWMSEKSVFKEGMPVRGGIPVCFPWFGPHPVDSQKPPHGFARIVTWEVTEISTYANGASHLKLSLHHSPATKKFWPFAFSAYITVIVGEKLEVKLSIINTGSESFEYTDALHTYLNVKNIENIGINGLGGVSYYEPSAPEAKKQEEPLLLITKEENRRYVNHTGDCIVNDKGFSRKIRVSKTGSKVTVVWNPGPETSKNITDMHADGYKTFICVEAANAMNDIIKLAPAESFSISTTINTEQ